MAVYFLKQKLLFQTFETWLHIIGKLNSLIKFFKLSASHIEIRGPILKTF